LCSAAAAAELSQNMVVRGETKLLANGHFARTDRSRMPKDRGA